MSKRYSVAICEILGHLNGPKIDKIRDKNLEFLIDVDLAKSIQILRLIYRLVYGVNNIKSD